MTKTSAERIGRFTRDIEHLPSHADHRGLVRFEHSQDGRYVSLIEKLKSMAAKAQQTVVPLARYSYTRNESQSGKYRHLSTYCREKRSLNRVSHNARMKHLWSCVNLTNLPTIQLSGTSYYLSLEIGSSLDEHKKSTALSKSCSSTKTARRWQLLDWEASARRK